MGVESRSLSANHGPFIGQVHGETSFALALLSINYSFRLHSPQPKEEYFTIHTH